MPSQEGVIALDERNKKPCVHVWSVFKIEEAISLQSSKNRVASLSTDFSSQYF